jgi:hypothetical protein
MAVSVAGNATRRVTDRLAKVTAERTIDRIPSDEPSMTVFSLGHIALSGKAPARLSPSRSAAMLQSSGKIPRGVAAVLDGGAE